MGDIGKALEGVYDPSTASGSSEPLSSIDEGAPKDEAVVPSEEELLPFAKVNGVAPGSPAADAVCLLVIYVYVYAYTLVRCGLRVYSEMI